MRTISGGRNRTVLILGGLLLIVAAAWVLASGLNLPQQWKESERFLADHNSTIGEISSAHHSWLLPTVLAVTVVLAIVGLLMLFAQIPTAPPRNQLRFADEDDQLLGFLDPDVLDRALEERVEDIAGINDASVRIGGTTEAPWIQATIDVDSHAEVAWVVSAARTRLRDDIATATEAEPTRVDLMVELSTHGSSQSTKVVEVGSERVTQG